MRIKNKNNYLTQQFIKKSTDEIFDEKKRISCHWVRFRFFVFPKEKKKNKN